MYKCESWTIKKAECQRTDAFNLLEKTLESPLDFEEIKLVNPKGNQPWIFAGRIDAEAEMPTFWPPDAKTRLIGKDPDAGKDWRQKKREVEDEMLQSITNSVDMNLSKHQEMVKDTEAWSAAVHGVAKSHDLLTEQQQQQF